MGTDLTITQCTDYRTDEKGRRTWTTTVLCDMRSTHQFVNEINWSLENGLECCASYSISGKKLWECANDVENVEEREYVLNELKKAEIINDEEEWYEINVSW